MSITRRPLARAGALAFAAFVFAACGGDSTSPLHLEPEDFVVVGEDIALQIEQSALSLTASGALAMPDQPPVMLSLGSRTSTRVLGGPVYSFGRLRPAMQIGMGGGECGSPSQEVPTDTDEDGVPDNFTITFSLPDCRFELDGGVMEITGLFRISDPTRETPGFALSFGMDNFRFALDGDEGDLSLTQNGTETVSATTTRLTQIKEWVQNGAVSGYGSFGMSLDWTNTFEVNEGPLVVGEPLKSGQFSPNGTVRYRQGNRVAVLNVDTVEPLAYDMDCAADYAEGLADSPFNGGVVDVSFSGAEGSGFVRISYDACSWANVIFIAEND